jgi:hypothetical protein
LHKDNTEKLKEYELKYLAQIRINQPSDNASSNGQKSGARDTSTGPNQRRRSQSSGKRAASTQADARIHSRPADKHPAVSQGPSAPPESQILGNANPAATTIACSWLGVDSDTQELWTAMAPTVLKKPETEQKKRLMHIF